MESIQQKSRDIVKQKLEAEKFVDKKSSKSKDFEDRISNIESNFMKKGEELDLIKLLELIALENGVTQTISPSSPKETPKDSFDIMILRLNITGNFKNVLNYVQSIESSKYYININSINIVKTQQQSSRDENLEQLNSVSCTILAETYWK